MPDPSPHDDLTAAFLVDGAPLIGRVARLGAGSLDPILRRHAYPPAVADLLGQAILFAALLGALLKTQGRLIVQAEGDGPVRLLAGEFRADGALRGYARLRPGAAELIGGARSLPPRALIGEGVLAITLDRGRGFEPHQGIAPLDRETLSECAEDYFRTSAQTETRVRLAVGEVFWGDAPAAWRGGGLLLQRVAADQARGDTSDGWTRAGLLLDTLSDAELVDPNLAAPDMLYRLFHEDGVRVSAEATLRDECSCDEGRLIAALSGLSAQDVAEMVEPDGAIHATCEFCARTYRLAPSAVGVK